MALLGLFGLIAVLLAAGGIYLSTRAGGQRILGLALASARNAIRGDLQAEALEFRGDRLVLHRAKLLDPEGALVAEIEEIDVRLSLLSLVRRTLDIRSLRITAPRLHLRADERGLNLSRAIEPRQASAPKPEDRSASYFGFLLRDLELTDGALLFAQVSQNEKRQVQLAGFAVRGSAGYASPSGSLALDVELKGELLKPQRGPLSGKVTARGSGDRRTAQVALGLAGLRLEGELEMAKEDLRVKLAQLKVPPELISAWVPSYPVLVPIAISGEAAKHESTTAGKIELKAGSTTALLEGSIDLAALRSAGVSLRAQHVNLRELIRNGPESSLELAARAQGGGQTVQALEGTLELVVPAGRVRAETVGPILLEARARRGVVEISKVVADLPGLRVAGAGRASERDLTVSGTLTAANLDALAKTLGSLLQQPPLKLSGNGDLQFAISGPTKHPGVSFNGAFSRLRYEDYAVESLSVTGNLPDISKPLQSQLALTAARVVTGGRTLRNLAVNLTARGRDLEANIHSAGFAQLVLHAAALIDADHHGLLLSALDVRYPEEQWSLQRPSHIRFPSGEVSAEPLELRSGVQTILVAGSLRKNLLKADLQVQRLDLALLPKPLTDPALRLRGLLSAEVHADGRLPQPAVKARVNLQNGGFRQYGGVELRADASYQRDRAVGTADASGLGTRLRTVFDVPIRALKERKREPVKLDVSLEPTDIARVLEALQRPEQIGGTAAAKIELTGTADDPKLKVAIDGRSLRREKSPPIDLTLVAQSDQTGKLGSSLEWMVGGSKSSIVVRTPLTLASVLQRPPSAASLQTMPVDIELDINKQPLQMLRDAGVVQQQLAGTASLRGELRGSAKEPAGKLVLSLAGVAVGSVPPIDASLVATASSNAIEASANAQRGSKRLLDLTASLQVPPGRVQGIDSVANRPLSVKATIGPVAIDELRSLMPSTPSAEPQIPPPEGTPAPESAVFDGVLRADLTISGSLADPVADVRCELDQLTAEKAQVGNAKLQYTYRQASSNLSVQIASPGGTLDLTGRAKLDLSYGAIRQGLDVAKAPVDVALKASRFDLAALSGVTPTVRAIRGTLDADANIQGTIGTPAVHGKLEWNQGVLALVGYGDYQRIHLLVDGTQDDLHLRELLAYSGRGEAKISADARRSGNSFALTGQADLDKFPIISDDQLVATLSVTSKLQGRVSPELVDIHPLEIRQARVELPDEKRKNLQPLSLPDDIVLLRDGVPINKQRFKKATTAVAGLGGSGDQVLAEEAPEEKSKQQVMATIDAPRNIWIRGNDLNIEIGLSDGFRVEYSRAVLVFGEVKVLRGRVDALGRRFDMQKNSTVRFSGPPDTPTLDVTAEYNNEREQVKVLVTVRGQGKNMSISTSSEPPLTETEIYTLIATGHRTLRTNSGSSTSGSQLAVSALGSLAATQLKNVLASKLPLDVLSIQAGGEGGLSGTKLEAGTYVTDRIYIGYTARINARPELGQNSNEVRIDYQISPRWYLEATYGDAKAGGADLLWSRDY